MQKKKLFISLFAIMIFALTTVFVSADTVFAPGGEVTDTAQLLAALGGDDAAWLTGETLTLRRDITLQQTVRVSSGSYTIVGAGCSIYRGSDCSGAMIEVTGDAVLTLGGVQNNSEISLTLDGSGGYSASDATVPDDAKELSESGIAEGFDAAALSSESPVILLESGRVELSLGTLITSNASYSGGGVIVRDGTFSFTGGSIANCAAVRGGAVCIEGGSAVFPIGRIGDCIANMGGAFYIDGGELALIGGTVGGILTKDSTDGKTLTSNGNTALRGGGIYAASGLCRIEYCDIAVGRAEIAGGAIYCEADASVEITAGTIRYCESGIDGGAIYTDGLIHIINCDIADCKAENGASIYVADGGELVSESADIADGKASVCGGGIVIEQGGTASLAHGSIVRNNDAPIGAGIVNYGTLSLFGSVNDNEATVFGSGIIHDGESFSVGGYAFVNNNDISLVRRDDGSYPVVTVTSELIGAAKIADIAMISEYDIAAQTFKTDYTDGIRVLEGDAAYLGDAAAKFTVSEHSGASVGADGALIVETSPIMYIAAAAAVVAVITVTVIVAVKKKAKKA